MILFIIKYKTENEQTINILWSVSPETENGQHGVSYSVIWPTNIQTTFFATDIDYLEEQQFRLEVSDPEPIH